MGMPNMGEGNTGSNKTTYNILYGSFRRRVKEGTPGAEDRTLKKGKDAGKTVWELTFNSYAGYIDKIQLHCGEYGDDIAIDFSPAEGETSDARIFIPLYSAQGRSFINHLLNSNPKNPIRLSLWRKDEDSKTYLYIAEWTDEKWTDVERKYNVWNEEKGQLEGLPEVIEGVKNGKPDYDYTAHTAALTDELQKIILPAIQSESWLYDPKDNKEDDAPKAKAPAMGGGVEGGDEDDDLPF